jgi:hypothetical protein
VIENVDLAAFRITLRKEYRVPLRLLSRGTMMRFQDEANL